MASFGNKPSLSKERAPVQPSVIETSTLKPPRKSKACVECQKQKIKCHRNDADQPCIRCTKRGLPCNVNRSLRMLLEGDATWKRNFEKKVERLAAAVQVISEQFSLPDLPLLLDAEYPASPASTDRDTQHQVVSPEVQADEDACNEESGMRTSEPDFTPASIPANCVPNVTNQSYIAVTHSRPGLKFDIIACGIITVEQAEQLFDIYHQRLDHYVYRIIGEFDSLSAVRATSPLLTVAICTVASLHHPSNDIPYDRCLQEFMRLSAAMTFARRKTLSDISALFIGAFWLPEISYTLIGAAVRIATELQLHRAILNIANGNKDTYLRARLYYFLYVCDHHFSVPYGRPPLTGEYESISLTDQFLDSVHAVEDDTRLISQIKIWSIIGQVFQTFGTDSSRSVPPTMIGQLQRFNIYLDTWRADWYERFSRNPHVGNYPQKGVGMHYHFAKLYLCAHSFRGIVNPSVSHHHMPQEMLEMAEIAISSATHILRLVNNDPEIQSFLNGLPLYFDTMIAFAAVFLLKMSTEYVSIVKVDTNETLRLLLQTVVMLEEVGLSMKPKHLLIRISHSLRLLLDRFEGPEAQLPINNQDHRTMSLALGPSSMSSMDMPLVEGVWDSGTHLDFSLGYYDLLEPLAHNTHLHSDLDTQFRH